MARVYDIIDRLKRKNVKPTVKLDEEHEFPINTKKTNVLCIMAYIRKQEKKSDKNDPEADIKMTDHVIKMALGEEAAAYIESQDYTYPVIGDIVDIIMSAITDTEASYEKEEKEEKK